MNTTILLKIAHAIYGRWKCPTFPSAIHDEIALIGFQGRPAAFLLPSTFAACEADPAFPQCRIATQTVAWKGSGALPPTFDAPAMT
jgi:hypothetical protein